MQDLLLREIARMLDVVLDTDLQVSGFRVDSRKIEPGDLFFALPGEKTDGQAFLSHALNRGAVGAVVRKGCPPIPHLPLIFVDDPMEALRKLSSELFRLHPSEIIGITGSVGKTTTKEFAATLLENAFPLYKSPGGYNSQVTFPLNFLNRSGQEKLLVLEMGMSRPGEITRLAGIAPPDIAVITKIALSHVSSFPNGLEGIAQAKAEIASQEKTRLVIVDSAFLQYRKAAESIRAEKITFSTEDRSADYYLSFIDGKYRIDERGVRAYQFDLPFTESHFLHNLTAAFAIARQKGMSWEAIEARLPNLVTPKMRFEKIDWMGMQLINDTYNSNPASMRAALENLPEPKEGGKKIAVFGAMQKELGSFSREAHIEIGLLAQKHVDILFSIGEEAKPMVDAFSESKKPCEHFECREELLKRLCEMMRPDDIALFKGARDMQMDQILESFCAASPR